MSSNTLPVCPKTGSTSPSLTVHLCLHTALLREIGNAPDPERLQFAIKFIVGHGGGSSRVDVRCQCRAAIITERLAERSA